jgi:hypothetical protein
MSTNQQLPECETAGDEEEIDCWNCEDKGFFVTVGGVQMPCPDCRTGDMFFAHDRKPRLIGIDRLGNRIYEDEEPVPDAVFVDDGLGEQAEDELEAWERSRD